MDNQATVYRDLKTYIDGRCDVFGIVEQLLVFFYFGHLEILISSVVLKRFK